jgi:hypothetical protein
LVHGRLGWQVHVELHPISPVQISPLAQSAFELQVFSPVDASAAVGDGAVVSAGAAEAAVFGAAGSAVGGAGGGADPQAIASALSATNERMAEADCFDGRFMRPAKRGTEQASTARVRAQQRAQR